MIGENAAAKASKLRGGLERIGAYGQMRNKRYG